MSSSTASVYLPSASNLLRMCDFIYLDIRYKESQRKKHIRFQRWLLPLLSPTIIYMTVIFKLLPYVVTTFEVLLFYFARMINKSSLVNISENRETGDRAVVKGDTPCLFGDVYFLKRTRPQMSKCPPLKIMSNIGGQAVLNGVK